ncbi:crispr-associated protein cas1 [Leptolyngbya sp. Heron Island J]|uniref:four helix bundle protein n=1 Tax=Leptolyngbya sp. Heron Island J TaxID=1385935 RepID=UPI0003B96680|nr:four helix bundle protein [Leptolyngbya sp. Heron Island J]ESA34692.1 crispr-associated protein cas1 [Leptolyngbya sp. Heron Island J]
MQVYLEHLHAAWRLVQRGSPAAGVDGITTDLFAGVVHEQLGQMQRQLRRECYRASPAKGFFVSKKNGGQRLIGLSTVRDRVRSSGSGDGRLWPAAHLAEAWGKRRYHEAFIAKLSEAETKAAAVQTWLAFAVECGYRRMRDWPIVTAMAAF